MRRREQAVHDALVGAGRVVGEKGVGLGGRGRQAGQIEINAAQQAGGIGLGRGRETFAAETREDEVVDGIAGGRGEFAGGGQRRARGFHVGPMLGVLGPDRALFDPAAQRGDLCRGQALALGRHHIVGVGGRDAGEQRAGVGLAGDERGFSRFAAPQRGAAGGEGKAALGFSAPWQSRQRLASRGWMSRTKSIGTAAAAPAASTGAAKFAPKPRRQREK